MSTLQPKTGYSVLFQALMTPCLNRHRIIITVNGLRGRPGYYLKVNANAPQGQWLQRQLLL
jgi:hypothetical protein